VNFLSIIGGVVKLFTALFGFFRDRRLREEGAAQQREVDNKAENERLNKAGIAANDAAANGLHGAEKSKYNRDNQPS
jgi:hypothetical protein